MILSIPLQATPNQRLSLALGGRDITLRLRTLHERLYLSVYEGSRPLALTRLCHNRLPLAAAGGIFYFDDAHGSLNPHWQGLGSRFRLLWSAP